MTNAFIMSLFKKKELKLVIVSIPNKLVEKLSFLEKQKQKTKQDKKMWMNEINSEIWLLETNISILHSRNLNTNCTVLCYKELADVIYVHITKLKSRIIKSNEKRKTKWNP